MNNNALLIPNEFIHYLNYIVITFMYMYAYIVIGFITNRIN